MIQDDTTKKTKIIKNKLQSHNVFIFATLHYYVYLAKPFYGLALHANATAWRGHFFSLQRCHYERSEEWRLINLCSVVSTIGHVSLFPRVSSQMLKVQSAKSANLKCKVQDISCQTKYFIYWDYA